MLNALKDIVSSVMKVPPEPHDPMGDVLALRVFRASKKYLYYRYMRWGIAQLMVLLFIGGFITGFVMILHEDRTVPRWVPVTFGTVAAAVFLLQLSISFFMVWLDYEMRWYKITDRSLRIRYGVWHVREHTVTFANIQNISVTQGPVQRLFGIAEVRVDTAGGGGAGNASGGAALHGGLIGLALQAQAQKHALNLHQAVFQGVDNAEEIRDLMMVRLLRVRDAGLGETLETAVPSTMPASAIASANWSPETIAVLSAFQQEAIALRMAAENMTL